MNGVPPEQYDDERQSYRPESEREGRDKPERKWFAVGTRGYRVMSAQQAIRKALIKPSPDILVDPYPEERE